MKKYYLKIEIRYSFKEYFDTEDYETKHISKTINSGLFNTEKECIDYGNEIIKENLWIEQYPGYIGNRLDRKFGRPFIAPHLKNGAHIFISVESLNIVDFEGINTELRKFSIEKITSKIV